MEAVKPHLQVTGDTAVLDFAGTAPDWRLQYYLARLIFHQGSPADYPLANALIVGSKLTHACHFAGLAGLTMLLAHSERLSPAAKQSLEDFVLRFIPDWMTDDFRFHGANDNAPFECAANLAMAGQYFKVPAYTKFALTRLQEIDRLLDLRGYIHEANSPTYSGVSIAACADMVQLIKDPDIKRIARRCEQRIWQEVMLHFHPGVARQVGPYSRGYQDDNAAQCTVVDIVMAAALPQSFPINPRDMFFPPVPGSFAHNTWLFQACSCACYAATVYHPPLELVERTLARHYPFSVSGSNEFMAIAGTPAGQSGVYLYATELWGVGTFSSRTWAGQTVPYSCIYRRRPVTPDASTLDHLASVRSVYTRMVVSPTCAGFPTRNDNIDGDYRFNNDHGSAFSVQHQGSTLLGYVPVCGEGKVSTVRASLLIPMHHSHPDEIRFGDDTLSISGGSYDRADWFFLRDGDFYLAAHPILSRIVEPGLCISQVARQGNLLLFNAYPQCTFDAPVLSREALRSLACGLVIEVGSKKEYGTFEQFIATVRTAEISKRDYGAERHYRYRRPGGNGVDLELRFDCQQLVLRRAAANGRLVTPVAKLAVTPEMPLID